MKIIREKVGQDVLDFFDSVAESKVRVVYNNRHEHF